MGIIRQKRKAETRALLLQAGLGVFAERGIEFATLDDIAQTAGLTKGAIYRQFPSKGAFLLALFEQYAAVARSGTGARQASWFIPLTLQFAAHAMRDPLLRRRFVREDVAASFRQTCDGLTAEGFRVVAELFQTGQMRHVSTRVALVEHPETAELALAVAMFTAARPARLVASYAELPTKFRDGRTVSVHNSPLLGSFAPPPSRVVVRLPIVRDPARLCRVKRAYLDRHYRGLERVPFEHRDDPARFLGEAMAGELKEQVEAGTWWRDDRAGGFRPRFTRAWVMTWRALPPFSVLRRRRIHRRASAILKGLNMAGPDPRPIAQPRTRVSLGGVAAVAVTVFLVTQLGSRVRHTSWTLPSDFAAPAAFPDAVRALEQLAGGKEIGRAHV